MTFPKSSFNSPPYLLTTAVNRVLRREVQMRTDDQIELFNGQSAYAIRKQGAKMAHMKINLTLRD